METTKGEMVILLYEETPIHRENFIKLVKKDFYDSLLFHRVIKDFMIQTGDPQSKPSSGAAKLGAGGPGYTLEAELEPNFIHKKGVLAAARQGDRVNPNKKSSGSQFYIVQGRKYPAKYLSNFEEKRGKPYTEEEKETYETIGGAPHLDGAYTVFGEVISGMGVIDEIANAKTGEADRPIADIYIINMKLLK